MMRLCWFLYFAPVLLSCNCALRSTIEERATRYRSLLLKYFDSPRHPLMNDRRWLFVRNGIIDELEKIINKLPNMEMETQKFRTEILYMKNQTTLLDGKNIIVTFHGRNRGTFSDNILLVGSHYDSENSMLQSVNDNGSGVVAMLECVRNLVDAIVNQRLELLNTVIFVAFDVQRSQYELVRDLQQKTGSWFYVNERLSTILNTEPKPKFMGAIILDSIMNYNHSQHSQILPKGYNESFPEVYQEIVESNNTGNFLNMIVNGEMKDLNLRQIFNHQWEEIDQLNRYPLKTLEIQRENASPALFEFLLQDHVTFWNLIYNGTAQPLPAILITDTGKWRGMPIFCDSNHCKANEFITVERLQMLDQIVLTIDNLILNSMQQESTSSTAFTAISSTAFLLLGVIYCIIF